MIVFDSAQDIDLKRIKNEFGRFMVKDYVKSVKGTSFPKYFDNTITEAEFNEQMKLFMEYRGRLYTGGGTCSLCHRACTFVAFAVKTVYNVVYNAEF